MSRASPSDRLIRHRRFRHIIRYVDPDDYHAVRIGKDTGGGSGLSPGR